MPLRRYLATHARVKARREEYEAARSQETKSAWVSETERLKAHYKNLMAWFPAPEQEEDEWGRPVYDEWGYPVYKDDE